MGDLLIDLPPLKYTIQRILFGSRIVAASYSECLLKCLGSAEEIIMDDKAENRASAIDEVLVGGGREATNVSDIHVDPVSVESEQGVAINTTSRKDVNPDYDSNNSNKPKRKRMSASMKMKKEYANMSIGTAINCRITSIVS